MWWRCVIGLLSHIPSIKLLRETFPHTVWAAISVKNHVKARPVSSSPTDHFSHFDQITKRLQGSEAKKGGGFSFKALPCCASDRQASNTQWPEITLSCQLEMHIFFKSYIKHTSLLDCFSLPAHSHLWGLLFSETKKESILASTDLSKSSLPGYIFYLAGIVDGQFFPLFLHP